MAIVIVVSVLALGAAAALTSGGNKHSLRGTFTLFDEDFDIDGDYDDCEGTGGYSDFDAGLDITVRDGGGTIIGAGTMRNVASREELADYLVSTGEADDEDDDIVDFVVDTSSAVCVLVSELDVEDADFYEIDIGRRGELSYSKSEMEDDDWVFALTLGG